MNTARIGTIAFFSLSLACQQRGDAIARSNSVPNAALIIPWYQDFTLGPPRYEAAQIRAQKKAGYDNGFQSWILWNPKSNYTLAALEPQS
jgi:hypothetical protein